MKKPKAFLGNSDSFRQDEMYDLDLKIEFNKPTGEDIAMGSGFETVFKRHWCDLCGLLSC